MKTAIVALGLGLVSPCLVWAADFVPYRTGPANEAHGVADPQRAWRNYALNCQGCHRPDGTGGGDTAPALLGHLGVFTRLAGGRTYLGRVPGVATSPLPDDQLAELLNWVLWRFDAVDVAPGFSPYTPEEIGRLRVSPLRTEAQAVRASLLAGAPSQ
jgi:mono/diheme cytochrome c family protein